ncbi:protein kinase [Actinomyces respiraculi]|uniref:non-specific serine/threonine protein kinase n=1 Tax=Actinomyces respiraculi TaxID=2744574 RepID=A0A7T0LN84_9ACTO|nr:protein kinase [Actinomyces respiraculi]
MVLRVVNLPPGRVGTRLLARLADLRELRHPALAAVREVIALPGDRAAVTSELIEGADLAVVLGARGSLTRSEGARVLQDVGSALACLHGAGLAHGDLSASNVMVSTGGGAVLIDLVSELTQSGTPPWAAPERESGGPATPASDVYSLGMLLRSCAEGGALLGQALERVLGDVLVTDPEARPRARTLAARAPEIARPGVIELPDGARLAAGALRAAAATPTRTLTSRSAHQRARVGRAGRPAALSRRVAARMLAAVLLLAVGLAGAWALHVTAAREGPVSGPQASVAEAVGADELTRIVVGLVRARDEAIEAGDAQALAATSVQGSSAAQADAAILAALQASGEHVEGLETRVSDIVSVDAQDLPDGAVAVALIRTQSASVRVGADGNRRTVPAQQPQRVVLVLLPDPWRVLEVRQAG